MELKKLQTVTPNKQMRLGLQTVLKEAAYIKVKKNLIIIGETDKVVSKNHDACVFTSV